MRDTTFPSVAVIAGDPMLRDRVLGHLSGNGFRTWGTGDVDDFFTRHAATTADIVVVDLGLTQGAGPALIRQLRAASPLGIVSLGAAPDTPGAGFALGADHHFDGPLDLDALTGALRALWRRIGTPLVGREAATGDRVDSAWELVPAARTLRAPSGAVAVLSDQEYALLELLMRTPGRVVPKPEILGALYPHEQVADTHRIDVILSRARKKLQRAGLPLPVRAVFGRGLMFLDSPSGN